MSDWQRLLRLALPALDAVYGPNSGGGGLDWTIGGGAAITMEMGHRETADVDIFIQRGSLKALTPAQNRAAGAISDTFQWPGHYLKFETPDGEIDFLSASLLTTPGAMDATVDGRLVSVETPEEVVVKKFRYRGATFTARDVFDLACVASGRPALATVLAREVPDMLERVAERIRVHEGKGIGALEAAIDATESGRRLLPRTFVSARAVLKEAMSIATGRSSTKPRSVAKGGTEDPAAGPPRSRDVGR